MNTPYFLHLPSGRFLNMSLVLTVDDDEGFKRTLLTMSGRSGDAISLSGKDREVVLAWLDEYRDNT